MRNTIGDVALTKIRRETRLYMYNTTGDDTLTNIRRETKYFHDMLCAVSRKQGFCPFLSLDVFLACLKLFIGTNVSLTSQCSHKKDCIVSRKGDSHSHPLHTSYTEIQWR